MKSQFFKLLPLFFLLTWLPAHNAAAQGGVSLAQEPTKAPAPTPSPTAPPPSIVPYGSAIPLEDSPPGVIELPLSLLDQSSFELRSPADSDSFRFRTPRNWHINPGKSFLELHYDTIWQSTAPNQIPVVEMVVNGVLAGTFLPKQGLEQVVRLPLPAAAFDDPTDFSHNIELVLYAGKNCLLVDQIRVTVRDDSYLHLDYDKTPIEPTLAEFPFPLEQGGYITETIGLIIPDSYTDNDLTAAAAVAAAMGEAARQENTTVKIVLASEAAGDSVKNRNLLVVGKPNDNDFLASLYQQNILPTAFANSGAIAGKRGETINENDGVLQIIQSPQNKDLAILVVTGNNDEGVLKAAQALSAKNVRFGFDRELVIVQDLTFEKEERIGEGDVIILNELGFDDVTLSGVGSPRASVEFFVPGSWRIQPSAFLNLSVVHSASLAPFVSGITVELNGKPVGSVAVSPDAPLDQQVEIPISPDDILVGANNILSFKGNLELSAECAPLESSQAWIRIRGASHIYLPHLIGAPRVEKYTLNFPYAPFAREADLSDVWLVLPNNPTAEELTGMAKIAWKIGDVADGPGFSVQATRGVRSFDDLMDFHGILIGRPSENVVISAFNDDLLQPFELETNELTQKVADVQYRLPAQFGVGVLQLMAAPWNDEKSAFVVSGTTDDGVRWALNGLQSKQLFSQMRGDLAFVRENLVETLNSQDVVAGTTSLALDRIVQESGDPELNGANFVQADGELYLPPTNIRPTNITALMLALFVGSAALIVAGVIWQRRKSSVLFGE